jgi:single-strand DNA-binding protein
MSLNTVILTGRAGRDPECRYFDDGTAVANLTLAVDRLSKGDDGPDWFDIEVRGKSAQVVADYVRKGSRLGIEGSLRQNRWVDRTTGEKRSRVVVSCYRVDLIDTKAEAQQRQSQSQSQGGAPAPAWNGPGPGYSDAEAPF